MKFAADSTTSATSSVAFDTMADVRNEVHWNSQVSRPGLVSPEPIGQGSRFESVNRGHTYQAEITTYDRPNRVVFEVTGKNLGHHRGVRVLT